MHICRNKAEPQRRGRHLNRKGGGKLRPYNNMALGPKPRVTRKRFTAAFEVDIICWQLRAALGGEQWRLQWRRRKHPVYLKGRRMHPAYRGVYVYLGTVAASNYGRVVRDDKARSYRRQWKLLAR